MSKWLWLLVVLGAGCERVEAGRNAKKTSLPDEPARRMDHAYSRPAAAVVERPAPAAAAPRPVVKPSAPPRPRPVPTRTVAVEPPPPPVPPEPIAPPPAVVSVAPTPAPAPRRSQPQNLPDGARPAVPSPDNSPPEFPAAARSRGLEGTVALKLVINESGAVSEIKVLKGDEPFVSAALAAVRGWRYTPATFQGEPIAVYKIVKVPFKLAAR